MGPFQVQRAAYESRELIQATEWRRPVYMEQRALQGTVAWNSAGGEGENCPVAGLDIFTFSVSLPAYSITLLYPHPIPWKMELGKLHQWGPLPSSFQVHPANGRHHQETGRWDESEKKVFLYQRHTHPPRSQKECCSSDSCIKMIILTIKYKLDWKGQEWIKLMLWFKQDLTLAWIGKQWKYRELGRFKMGRKKTSMTDSNISFMQLDDLTEEGTWRKKKQIRLTDDNQAFVFGRAEFEVTLRHLSGDVRKPVGYTHLRLRKGQDVGSDIWVFLTCGDD